MSDELKKSMDILLNRSTKSGNVRAVRETEYATEPIDPPSIPLRLDHQHLIMGTSDRAEETYITEVRVTLTGANGGKVSLVIPAGHGGTLPASVVRLIDEIQQLNFKPE